MSALKNQAIHSALMGDWNTAITKNQEILKEDPEDTETLNRLAFAFTVIGKFKDAKSTYQKVLRVDDQNPIALKNLKKLSTTPEKKGSSLTLTSLGDQVDSMFLEESGKTKVVELVNIADPKFVAHIFTGEKVNLRIKRLKVFVLDEKNQYIGMLPDNISNRLIKFLKGGNEYQACIKSVGKQKVTVFIREMKRANRFKNQPSFLSGERSHLLFDKNYGGQSHKGKNELKDEDYDEEDESL